MRYVIANWKMNMKIKEINQWLNEFSSLIRETKNTTIIIAPSYIHIPIVKVFADNYPNVKVSAQDTSEKKIGAHTGEINAEQIKELCEYCIVGHSELEKSTETRVQKAKVCMDNGIIPILCSKNPEKEWENVGEEYLLAWEDPTNISKNGVYNEKPFEDIHKEIKHLIEDLGHNSVIYGGSVNESNSLELAKIAELKGVLVGNASLNPKTFWTIVGNFENN